MNLRKKMTLACTLAAGVTVQAIWANNASAQTNYFWDTSNTAGLGGGAGTWSTVASNWNDSVGTAGANIAWPNGAGNNIANFSGTSGLVTVSGTVQTARINSASAYSFTGGTIDFGANAGVLSNTSAITSFDTVLAGTGGFSKLGASGFTYTGSATFTGGFTVGAGTFTLGSAASPATNRIVSSNALTLGSSSASGILSLVAATGTTNTQNFSGLSLGSGLNTLQSSGASATNLASTTFTGTYTRSANGVFSHTNAAGFTLTSNFTVPLNDTNVIDGILVGASRTGNAVNSFIANNNLGNGAPTGTNNTWSSGTHTVAAANNGTAYTGTTASLRISGTRTVTLGSGAVINTGMISNNGGASLSLITGGTLTSGNGKDIILLGGDTAYRTQIDSQIVNNGSTAIGLLIAVPGTNTAGSVLINGSNTYTGDTVLANGTVSAGSDAAFGTAGTIRFTGGSLLAPAGASRSLGNNIELPFAATIGAGSGGYNLTLGGNISGAGTLTLNPAGTVTLSGTNTSHSGAVIVNSTSTVLALGSANAIGTAVGLPVAGTVTSSNATARSFSVNNYTAGGATFGQAGTGDLSVTMPTLGAIAYNVNVGNTLTRWVNTQATGAGATLTKAGAGALAFTGDFTITGSAISTGLTIGNGLVQIGDGGATGSLAITGAVANVNGTGGALAFNKSTAIGWSTPVTGSVGLQQLGGGTTTLAGTHTYTGSTTVNGGKLTVGPTGTINNSSGVSIGAGDFNYNSSTALAPTISFTTTGGKLSGTGTINTAVSVTSANTLSPGNSIGTMTIANTLSLAGIGSFELDKTLGVRTNDKVIGITAPPTFTGGTLSVSLTGSGFTAGDTWDLFDWTGGTITNTFASVPTGTVGAPSGFKWNTTNLYTSGVIGLDVAGSLISLTATQQNGNVATGGSVAVTGSDPEFSSEVDELTSNLNKASATISVAPGSFGSTVYAMLWLTGQDATTLESLRSDLDALSNIDAYTGVAGGDQYATLNAGPYSGFNLLVKFTGAAAANPGALNWDFSAQSGILVDKVAIVPEPTVIAGILGLGSLGLLGRRRRA